MSKARAVAALQIDDGIGACERSDAVAAELQRRGSHVELATVNDAEALAAWCLSHAVPASEGAQCASLVSSQ